MNLSNVIFKYYRSRNCTVTQLRLMCIVIKKKCMATPRDQATGFTQPCGHPRATASHRAGEIPHKSGKLAAYLEVASLPHAEVCFKRVAIGETTLSPVSHHQENPQSHRRGNCARSF